MSRSRRDPQDGANPIQLRGVLLILAALGLAALTAYLIIQAIQTPAAFLGRGG